MATLDQAAIEQSGSGLVRSLAMRDQKDPSHVSFLVVFESEAAARARESDERRQAGLETVRATMAGVSSEEPPSELTSTARRPGKCLARPTLTALTTCPTVSALL